MQKKFCPEIQNLNCREHGESHAQPQEPPYVADDVQHPIQLVPLISYEVEVAESVSWLKSKCAGTLITWSTHAKQQYSAVQKYHSSAVGTCEWSLVASVAWWPRVSCCVRPVLGTHSECRVGGTHSQHQGTQHQHQQRHSAPHASLRSGSSPAGLWCTGDDPLYGASMGEVRISGMESTLLPGSTYCTHSGCKSR